ncbi:phage major capsid protein [Thioclava sp. GXIMD2076]|uniref:phage major capsid protein n=1 Tax=Thioclava sp. GXIMD2076 TaxID=3131931 RepID=UPI0030CF1822
MPLAVISAGMNVVPAAVIGGVMGDAGDVSRQLSEIKMALDKSTDEVKQTAEKAVKMAERNGTLTDELKNDSDRMLKNFNELTQKQTDLIGKLEQLETKNRDLEQELSSRGGRGNGAPQSFGQMVAGHDAIKQFVAAGASGRTTFQVKNAITTVGGSGGGLIFPTPETSPVRMPRRTLSVVDLITRGRTDANLVPYTKQTTRANGAAPTAEGTAAPESSYGWTKAEAPVRKIAHVTHISEEAMADAAMLETELDSEMRYGLDLALENQIVAGDGTGENLNGLRTQATAFSSPAGITIEAQTRIDVLRLGLLQLTLADYAADGLLLHDLDWTAIETIKDTAGRYVFGNPATGTLPRLWSLDVSTTRAQSAGEWMAGNFMMAATYYDRSDVEILISSEHDQNFVEGMLTMKGTRRGTLAVKRPGALVKGTFGV